MTFDNTPAEDAWLEMEYEDRMSGTYVLAECGPEELDDLHYNRPPDGEEDVDDPCEDGHDWQQEDIADGAIQQGAAHVWRVYCSRCDQEKHDFPELEEEPPELEDYMMRKRGLIRD